ncbi:hypothetical protein ACS0TY_027859 [Phlomoides rotata]
MGYNFPEEVGNLSSLQIFNLGYNNLTGSVPRGIFNVSSLVEIILTNNNLSNYIPSDICNNTPLLRIISFSVNQLSGEFPATIWKCRELEALFLSANHLNGSIPGEIGSLSKLSKLLLGLNDLEGLIPEQLGNLTSLKFMDLQGTNLKDSIPSSIFNISTLEMLQLSSNQFEGTLPSTTGISLFNLEELHLSGNRFSGPIPHHLCQMSNLADLDLRANLLTGSIPECFWDLNKLLTLNLSSNYLGGNISTQVGNLKAIYRMDLSSNQFSGDIPSSFDGCQSLETLSLSNNTLTGSIPQSLGSVRGLSSLDLSINNLSGLIPLEELTFLEHFNVSYNSLLDGEIPNEGPFVNFTSESFVNNSALCGSSRFQVPPCVMNHETLRPRSKDDVRLVLYIVASLIAVVFWVMGIFLSITFVIIIRREKEARIPPHFVDTQPSLGSYVQLLQVTHGFSETNLLGSGGIGSVYKGTLSNGLSIAVKVFNLELKGATESFVTETEILSSIRHRNLIRVFGCCVNAEFKALVLAYMPNGSLEKLLYSDTYYLNLVQRLNIAVDVALALEYLHHHHTFTVVHCDIKPSNVLLDQDMTSHLSDFGVAKLFGKAEAVVQTTTFLGTIGYAPPEYGFEGRVSTMGDVYSYGIMLLELFTRKKPTDNMFNGEISLKEWLVDAIERNVIHKVVDPALLSKQNQHFLPKEWLCEAIERNAATEVVDPALLSTQDQQFLLKVLRPIFYLAIKCLAYSPYDRMNMIEVAFNLQKIKNIVDSEMTRKSSLYYSIAASSPQASQTTDSQLLVSSEEQRDMVFLLNLRRMLKVEHNESVSRCKEKTVDGARKSSITEILILSLITRILSFGAEHHSC